MVGVGVVQDAVAGLRDAYAALAAAPIEALTAPELLEVLDELETVGCQLPSQRNRLLARLQVETTAAEMQARSWRQVLATRWRISTGEASRRLAEAAVLGPRQSLTGQPLEPVMPAAAMAQSLGVITAEHVSELRAAYAKIPAAVDAATREAIEELVKISV